MTGLRALTPSDIRWEDLRFPASSVKLDSTNPPTETSYKGGQILAFSDTTDNKIYFTVQIPHAYKLGSNLRPHIHVALPTAGAGVGAENIKFDLTYSLANLGDTFPITEKNYLNSLLLQKKI